MEDNKKLYPPLPSNYVTIIDLQNRWLQQKQQQQQQEEEEKHIKIEKFEHNNKIIEKEIEKSNTQFQKFNQPKPHLNPNLKPRTPNHGKIYQKKQTEEPKKASSSSEINGGSVNRIEDGDCEEKSSRFRKPNFYKNPNFGNRKLIYRKFDGDNVVKKVSNVVSEELKMNVAVNSVEIDDRKVEDEKKKKKKKKKKKNRKNFERENVVDDRTVGKEDDRTVEKKDDQTVKIDNQVIVEDRTVEKKDDQTVEKKKWINYKRKMKNRKKEKREKEKIDDRTVEVKDDPVIAEDRTVDIKDGRTVEKKEVEVIVDDRTVEKKENEVIVEDRTVEIEEKLKEVLLMNGRSTAEIDGGRRREYGSYGRGYRRGYSYGRRSWGMGRGGNVTVDGFYGRGRSTVEDGGWGRVYRGYGGGENRGRGFQRKVDLVWVKKNGDCV